MKQKSKLIAVLVAALLLWGNLAFALELVTCGGPGESPCKISDMLTLVFKIIAIMLNFAGLVAIMFVFWGGLQMILATGSPEKIKKGKDTIRNSLLGLVLVLISYLIVGLVINAVTGSNQSMQDFFTNYFPNI